jgi:hypothetical protein
MASRAGKGWHVGGSMAACALLVSAGLAGCASQSVMTKLWKDPSFVSGPVHNVFVVGIRKDPVRRRIVEDAFVNALRARGVTATSSYSLFPGASPDTQQVIEAVQKNGYDAVLASVRLPDETTSRYIPGTIRREQVTSQDYYGRFHSYWVNVQDPGYTETDKIMQIQTDVWAITNGSGRLVWSGTLRTLESPNNRNVNATVSKDIMPQLEKEGVVPEKPK